MARLVFKFAVHLLKRTRTIGTPGIMVHDVYCTFAKALYVLQLYATVSFHSQGFNLEQWRMHADACTGLVT